MKGFILGAGVGVIIVAAAATLRPNQAHELINQAPDVNTLINRVMERLDHAQDLEKVADTITVTPSTPDPAPAMSEQVETVVDIRIPSGEVESAVVREASVAKGGSIDFENLAAGLARVSNALERLNRTMKPGSRAPSSGSATTQDPSSS